MIAIKISLSQRDEKELGLSYLYTTFYRTTQITKQMKVVTLTIKDKWKQWPNKEKIQKKNRETPINQQEENKECNG